MTSIFTDNFGVNLLHLQIFEIQNLQCVILYFIQLLNPRMNLARYPKISRKNLRHYSFEDTKYRIKWSIMVVESSFKYQIRELFISFHMQVSNILCHVCERSYRSINRQMLCVHARFVARKNLRHLSVL
jgi:hypothetical protein